MGAKLYKYWINIKLLILEIIFSFDSWIPERSSIFWQRFPCQQTPGIFFEPSSKYLLIFMLSVLFTKSGSSRAIQSILCIQTFARLPRYDECIIWRTCYPSSCDFCCSESCGERPLCNIHSHLCRHISGQGEKIATERSPRTNRKNVIKTLTKANKKTSLNRLFYYLDVKFMIESFLNDFIDVCQYVE